MKFILMFLIFAAPLGVQAQFLPILDGNPELVPISEDPGPNAEIIEVEIHSKTVPLEVTRYKETMLGYGALTGKILVPSLAEVTVLNHRNDGEEAPCLAGPFSGLSPTPIDNNALPATIPVEIKLLNQFRINKERGICQLFLIEKVTAEVQGVTFKHRLQRENGYRYIEDCPIE